MTIKQSEDQALDVLFEAAKNKSPTPSDAFLARLANDADTMVPDVGPGALARQSAPPEKTRVFASLKTLFTASGLSGAAALGVWIGLVMPDIVTTLSPLPGDAVALSAFLPGADLSSLSE